MVSIGVSRSADLECAQPQSLAVRSHHEADSLKRHADGPVPDGEGFATPITSDIEGTFLPNITLTERHKPETT